MARKSGTQAPRLNAVHLGELTDREGDDLQPHGAYDGIRLTGIDLGGRDLSGIGLRESVLDDVHAHETVFRAAGFSDVELSRFNAPVFAAPRSQWRDVSIAGSRIGSAELYESSFDSVHFSGSKIGFVNARGSSLQDVLFTDCTIDELDLSGSKLNRVSFVNTTVRSLNLAHSTLANVDLRGAEFAEIDGYSALRGATLSSYQVAMLAASFATYLGITVED